MIEAEIETKKTYFYFYIGDQSSFSSRTGYTHKCGAYRLVLDLF